jgi:NitT/TauT family transport system substrate-binding protein
MASAISFRKEVIDANPESIKAFLAAIEEATKLVKADPAKYKNVLSEQKIVPQPLIENYQTPVFPTAGVPTADEWKDALNWLKEKGILTVDVSYEDSVNAALLP